MCLLQVEFYEIGIWVVSGFSDIGLHLFEVTAYRRIKVDLMSIRRKYIATVFIFKDKWILKH